MNDAGELISLRSNPRSKDRRAGAPILHLIDIKTEGPGVPGRIVDIIERVEYVPIRPVSADDVRLLEPPIRASLQVEGTVWLCRGATRRVRPILLWLLLVSMTGCRKGCRGH